MNGYNLIKKNGINRRFSYFEESFRASTVEEFIYVFYDFYERFVKILKAKKEKNQKLNGF